MADDVLDRMRSGQVAAREVITAAMAAAVADGVTHRSVLLGLWQTAVSTILSVADGESAAAVFDDRAAAIKGQGANADAPIVRPDPETARKRIEEATKASAVLDSHLDKLRSRMADDGIEDDYPEVVLDTAVQFLSKAWGPAHARRALAEQSEAAASGATSPIYPPEPSAWNGQPRTTPGRPLVPGRRPPSVFAGQPPQAQRPPVTLPLPAVREPPQVDEAPPPQEDEAPPPQEDDAPPIEAAEDAPFSMEDEGFGSLRASDASDDGGLADDVPPPSDDGVDDFASALDSLEGEVPIPSLAIDRGAPLPDVSAGEEAVRDEEEAVAEPVGDVASGSATGPGTIDDASTADDLLAILDVPPPDEDEEEVPEFDDMPVPASTPAGTVPTAWQRMAAATDVDEPLGDTRWVEDDETPAVAKPQGAVQTAGLGDRTIIGSEGGEELSPGNETDGVDDGGPEAPEGEALGVFGDEPPEIKVSEENEPDGGILAFGRKPAPTRAEATEDEGNAPHDVEPEGLPVDAATGNTPLAPVSGDVQAAPVLATPPAPIPLSSPHSPASAPQAPRTHTGPLPRYVERGRVVECLMMVEADEEGKSSAYACVTVVSTPDDRHYERREMEGTLPFVGRRATLAAVVKVLVSLGEPGEEERLRFLVDSDAVLAGVAPPSIRPPRARPEAEAKAWDLVDVLCAGRTVQWVRLKPGIDKPMAEACDKMIRRRLG